MKDKSYNVAICNWQEFNPHIGGIERVSISLAESLLKRGVNVIFIAMLKSEYQISYTTPAPQYFLPDSDRCTAANKEEFKRLMTLHKINIVINQNPHSTEFSDFINDAVRGFDIKKLYVYHWTPLLRKILYQYPLGKDIFSTKEMLTRVIKNIAYRYPLDYITLKSERDHFRAMYAQCDKLIFLSKHYISEFQHMAHSKENKKLTYVNNMLSFPVKDDNYNKKKRILFCARLHCSKRPERALYVWREIFKQLPDWNLDIVGDGPLGDRLKELTKNMELERVNFYGFQAPEEFYKQSSIFLMTSDYEGWPLTLNEAMQYKCVPIAMDTYSSTKDIVDDGINGYLIHGTDCKAMADKALSLAQNTSLCNKMAEAAFEKSQMFSPENITNNWIKLFESLDS